MTTATKSLECNTAALQRWKILARVIKRDSAVNLGTKNYANETASRGKDEVCTVSVRRFPGFQLFQIVKQSLSKEDEGGGGGSGLQEKGYEWFEFKSCVKEQFSVLVRQRTRNVILKDLGGFDNTGNICIWPAEEVLAYHVIKHFQMFSGQAVCELGAGMTALAGLMLAVSSSATEVFLTDGNENAVDNIRLIIKMNEALFGKTKVYERCLKWGEDSLFQDMRGRFDCLICADCFVFLKYHNSLLETMNVLLKPQGYVIAFAPQRKNSLQQFCDRAQQFFNVEICTSYDDIIWAKHEEAKAKGESFYSEDIHYPLMVKLHKR